MANFRFLVNFRFLTLEEFRSISYVKPGALARLELLGVTFFLSPDFHELWCSVMSICLITEVKWQ